MCIVFRKDGGAVGAFATHSDEVLGCGEPDVFAETRIFCFGVSIWGHVAAGVVPGGVYEELETLPRLPGTFGCSSAASVRRDQLVAPVLAGEFRWLATVSRPDIFAPPREFPPGRIRFHGSDLFRIGDLVKTAHVWRLVAT